LQAAKDSFQLHFGKLNVTKGELMRIKRGDKDFPIPVSLIYWQLVIAKSLAMELMYQCIPTAMLMLLLLIQLGR
jgi:hypothetical protein